MGRPQAYLARLLSVVLNVPTEAADAPSAERCPGAASWIRDHTTLSAATQLEPGSKATMSDPKLFNELKNRVENDQAARKKWLANPGDGRLGRAVDAIDAENLVWLRNLIAMNGFPLAAQVGKEGVHLAWVFLQHADQNPKLQSDLLPVLEQRYSAGELPANDLARITDRVLMASGKPQQYGTQFDWFAGDFELPEPGRLAEIDTRRSQLGLMPLTDYVCTMRAARESTKQ